MEIDEKIAQLESELSEIRKNGNSQGCIEAIERIMEYCRANDLLQKAIYYGEELKELYKGVEYQDQLCNLLNLLGKCYSLVPDPEKAKEYLHSALQLSRSTGNRKCESYILTNLGLVQRRLDNLDESLESYLRAKEIMEEFLEDPNEEKDFRFQSDYLQVLDQMGVLYSILKQPQKSLEYLELSLEKAREADLPVSIFNSLINLGVHYSEKDIDKSLQYYQEALPYVEKSGQKHILSVVLNNIGGVYEDKENYPQALDYYFQALKLVEEYDHRDYLSFFLKHIGSVYYKQAKYEEALDYVSKSLATAESQNQVVEMEENYHLLSKIYRSMGNYEKALEYSENYIELKEKSMNRELQERVTVLHDKYENTRKALNDTRKKNSLISDVLQKKIKLDFIGCSPAIMKVHDLAMQAAKTPNTNVLVSGESGTGKEIIANIIHYASSRKDNILISVNSGSIPEHLMESAFFGHRKGAFTGAISDQAGYLAMADKGTLFLDELGDMSINLQKKLLRVLENRRFLPLGASEELESDFRLITATNKDIDKLIDNNEFRVDLFYRINTIEIHIPPLRERKSDILPLTEHFLGYYAQLLNKKVPRLDTEVIEYLNNYSFPGNVRELKNMMERVMITVKRDKIYAEDFDLKVKKESISGEEKLRLTTLAEMEEAMIRKALQTTGYNISRTAELLGIHYTTLNRKLKNLNISKEYK